MKALKSKICMAPLLITALTMISTASHAAMFNGEAVSAGGVDDASVGLPPVGNEIEYYIPLAASHTGTYGVTPANCGATGVGTCSDYGSGQGYAGADALKLNLFFDTSSIVASATAQLDIFFDDLDLGPINDPTGFFESMSFSYWDAGLGDFTQIGGTIDETVELTNGAFAGAANTDLVAPLNADDNEFVWSLDLAALGIMDAVNNGFWVQLGFGSQYTCPTDSWKGKSRKGKGKPHNGKCKPCKVRNTSEFLSATLDVSPVPVPSAVWLFGSALLGFIGVSRRTRV